VAKIILGTVQFGLNYGINNAIGKPTVQQIFEILSLAKSENIDILDTAEDYGDAIQIIGQYHAANPPFKIISKFNNTTNVSVEEIVTNSLTKLNIKALDALLFHRFSDFLNNQNFAEMQALKVKKLVNKIGVSVYTNSQFEIAIDNPAIDIIQLPFNLLDNYSQRGTLLKLAKKKNKEIHIRSVFLQGLFFKDRNSFSEKLKPLLPYLNTIEKILQETEITISQLALQYALSIKEIDYVLVGVDNKEQLAKNISDTNVKINTKIFEQINQIEVLEKELLLPINWS
jgi:uncharacterized protein